ncbi:PREDICTED: nuclear pore membrane glycoprotein 210-like [Fragaria vesca subsp. vesca]
MSSLAFLLGLILLTMADQTASHLSSGGPHIADVNILLPPKMTHPVEYRLQGSDGCFKWSWDHHDILSVLPEYNATGHCSTSARLTSVAPYSGRKETAVYATDVNTGVVIRCKVFIDKLSRIQIFHNSVKLDLDGLATLQVRAFDDEENVFSSLVGLQFMWQLLSETNVHHLVHVPLKDSPLSDCGGLCGDLDVQIKLEDNGVFSDMYVVKGIEIGHEIVSVHLLEPQFKHMADKIVLTVAEAMSLEPPSPVLVLVGAAVRYNLKVIRENKAQVVNLPSPHHQWSSSNSSVANVDSTSGLTNALSLGVTNVIVEDTRVTGHIQVSSLNVVLPDSLSLYMTPLSASGDPVQGTKAIPSMTRWFGVSGHQYLIQMKVFSQGPDAQEIYITENDDLKLSKTHSDYWQIFPVSDDIAVKHSWQNSVVLKATSWGQGKLTASLTYFSALDETKEVLKVVQELTICDQVKFSLNKTVASPTILLPWVPSIYQEVELKVSGGCAKASTDYKWYSSDMGIVSVSASGVVQAKKPGKATIKVLSIFDSFNYDEVVIEVSVPTSMSMLPNFPVETVVGSHLQAAVTMKASNGAYFYRCDAFSSIVRWKVGSGPFNIVKGEAADLHMLGSAEFHTSSYGAPCSWAELYASASGRATLHATLPNEYHNSGSSFHGPIVLKASSLIGAYPPLNVRQAGDGNHYGGYFFDLALTETDNPLVKLDKVYLVPGTCLDIMLLGGPEQWKIGVEFVETVEILNKEHGHTDDGASVQRLSETYRSLYRVSCEMLGTYNIVFKRGNLVGEDHPMPAVADVLMSLICSIPTSIVMIADEPVNHLEVIRTAIQADRSSGRIRVTPITVANNRTIRLAAVGISSNGEAFGNSSSLHLQWELNSCDGLAYWDDADNLQRPKYSWEKFLSLQNVSGVCIVRATAIGFYNTMGHHLESSENALTDAIHLQLVSTLRISPEFHLVVFNPNAKVNLAITGGSCFLKVGVNDSQVVEVIQPPTDLQCSQLVLSPKGLGTALVTVKDIGLAPPLAASAVVQVAEIDWIKIVSPEVICLMEGNSQTIDIVAGISDGRTFDSYQFAYINIQVHVEDQIIEVLDINSNTGGGYINVPEFKIFASHLGITTFFVSAMQQSGHEIFSQPIMVEVYAAPEIHPHDIFLVPGASYVLTLKGGPTLGVNVEYTSMDDEVATIDRSSGRLSASLPGNTTISATVLKNGETVICRAYTTVKVGVPSSVILNAQSELLGVGKEMPLYPVFSEGDLFSVYEQCQDYHWSGEDEKVLSFYGLEHLNSEKYGSQLDYAEKFRFTSHISEEDLGFIKVVLGRSAGRTNVAVSFSCEFVSSGSKSWRRIYNASVSISVVPDPPLALGVPITWILPPHYTTSSLLPLSSELHGQWDTQSHKGTIIYSLLRNVPYKNEVLQKDVISIEGDRIKTSESNNLACIQAKDRMTGRIEIAACVKVAEVAQIRISDDWLPFRGVNLVLGAELSLPIVYLDALGNRFHEAYDIVLFDAETDNPDVVSVNTTLGGSGIIHLKAMRHGRALVRVSIASMPLKSDYILISVGAHIHPQNPVIHIGSHVNFSIEGLNDQISGRWLTANESVISVSPLSGEAEVIGEGSTQVHFEALSMKLRTTVTVLTDDIVSVDAPRETLTNVPFPTKGYNFSVKISDKFKAFGNTKGLQYVCRVDPPFVGYSNPWIDLDTGNSYCLFFPYTPEHLVRFKSKEMKPDITVSINASLRGADHVSGSASALFVGGFSVLEMGKLNLTPDSNKTIITILGNTDVEIYWHDRDLLLVTPIHKEGFGIGGRAKYEVRMLGTKRFKDTIFITLPSNGQSVEIYVNSDPGETPASETTTISYTFWPTVLGGLAILILIVVVFKYYSDKPDRSHIPVAPATPSMAAPITPERGSPADVSDLSPRTPQPFMDYVRRTIDETPYYRREPRRRLLCVNSRRKIFIGGLARETTTAQFVKHFGNYGEIIDSVIMKDRKTGQPRGFGFVTYADPSVVDTVIEETHVINGKQVEIKRTIPRGAMGSKDFKTKKIFVGGIPTTVNEDEFSDFFSQFGEVKEHQIMRDHSTGRSRGFGFVTFETEQAVDNLLDKGNKLEFAGAQVEIKKAEPKKQTTLPPPPSKRYNDSRPAYGGGYGDSYGGFGGGGGYGGAGAYRSTASAYAGRGTAYGGYSGSEFGGYGVYGGGGIGAYRGEPSVGGYAGRYGGAYSRGYDLGGGGGYGGTGGESYGGYGSAGGGAGGGYGSGSGYDAGFGGGYGGGSGASFYGSSRGGYGGAGSGRYHPYGR